MPIEYCKDDLNTCIRIDEQGRIRYTSGKYQNRLLWEDDPPHYRSFSVELCDSGKVIEADPLNATPCSASMINDCLALIAAAIVMISIWTS